jgi:hypothetical protein
MIEKLERGGESTAGGEASLRRPECGWSVERDQLVR